MPICILEAQIEAALCPGMSLPEPLRLLFRWIEANHFFQDVEGKRNGFLFDQGILDEGWTETERPGGTMITFFAGGSEYLGGWFSHSRDEVLQRLCVFATTGAEGSMAAFWLDPNGVQHIVHLGSGSGSTLTCVLARDPVDFLRLIAIGYDEICWSQFFAAPPNGLADESDLTVHPNSAFQQWVTETFSVTIPSTAIEVVQYPSCMQDVSSSDHFWQWLAANET